MASKYAGLKGKIPEQPTEREQDFRKIYEELREEPLSDLVNRYNTAVVRGADLAARVKANNLHLEVLEVRMRELLTSAGADAVTIAGYTWSEKFEPYPVAEDPVAIVQYFKTHGMEDQLTLKASELATRLKSFVKEEALNNELDIQVKTVTIDGEDREVTEVRSQIPGVRVFLKGGLSRVKTSKGATE